MVKHTINFLVKSINILQEGIKIMIGWNDQDSLLILSSLEDIA